MEEKAPWRDPDMTISRVPRAKLLEELSRRTLGLDYMGRRVGSGGIHGIGYYE